MHGARGYRRLCVLLLAVVAGGLCGRAEAQRGQTGSLILEGDQPGAEVFIDAERVGTLPLEPLALPVGDHTIRVARPGYTELTDVFRIRPHRETTVLVELMAVSMVLLVHSEPPGAQAFVDGRFAGTTPVEVDLLEGEHSLRVRKSGHREVLRTVQAMAGHNETLDLSLVPIPIEEVPERLRPEESSWYEKPVTWVAVGGAALLVAAGVILVVVLTADQPDEADKFCEAGPDGCVLLRPTF